jgi:hypothetical protein
MDEDTLIKKELKFKHKEWVDKSVPWTKIERGDLHYVQDIIRDIIDFDPSLANIKVDIVRARGHYNIIFKNWNKPFQLALFYNTFLNKETRDYKYDVIREDVMINPHPDGETEGPVLQVFIVARNESTEKKRTY